MTKEMRTRMQTSPVMARRVIPAKERLQKALITFVTTAATVGAAWVLLDLSRDSDPKYLAIVAGISVLGLAYTLYFAFKKHESASTKEGNRAIRERIDDDRSGAGWTARIAYNIRRFLCGIIVFSGLLVSLAGVGVIGFQVYGYLRIAEWQSISVFSVVVDIVPWLQSPQSWIGLYKVLPGIGRLADCRFRLALEGPHYASISLKLLVPGAGLEPARLRLRSPVFGLYKDQI
jgi:hypothetical protein